MLEAIPCLTVLSFPHPDSLFQKRLYPPSDKLFVADHEANMSKSCIRHLGFIAGRWGCGRKLAGCHGEQEEPGFYLSSFPLCDLPGATYTLFVLAAWRVCMPSFIWQVHIEKIQNGGDPFWIAGVSSSLCVILVSNMGRFWGKTSFPSHQRESWVSRSVSDLP